GGGGALRSIFRQELAAANLPDGEEHHSSERLSFFSYRLNAPRIARIRSALMFSDGVVSRSLASRASQSTRVADMILPERLSKRLRSDPSCRSRPQWKLRRERLNRPPKRSRRGRLPPSRSGLCRGAACLSSIRSSWDAVRR